MDANIINKIEKLQKKYDTIGQDLETHLDGLLYSKPMRYWDFVQTDALLNLQVQRTTFPDEMVFLMYHQINELLFKMILWEMQQISHHKNLTASFFTSRLGRISRYFDMLATSFDVMGEGMDVEQYMKFRDTLTPASGFQSAQYRMIEICATNLINLIDIRVRETIDTNTPYNHAFENMYWQAAGKDYKTGKKSYLLNEFEDKYKDKLVRLMKEYNTINLYDKYKSLPKAIKNDINLKNAMRHFDYTVNIKWVMHHYHAACKYLLSQENTEATGGSDWQKYMLPKYQKRIFFPNLWSKKELKNWGITNLESYETL
ncbi:MAG: tryptophan 2,3-dioxygenase family protein [Flavobacteriaceae bacterium]|nr:tryptophan 2,3-dioxygenase family protein [Flavobacteriaceae bacterium]